MGTLELYTEVQRLEQLELWWEGIFNAHFVNDGAEWYEIPPFLYKVFKTKGVTYEVILDKRNDRLRTIRVGFGKTRVEVTVTRTVLEKWLSDMRVMTKHEEDANVDALVSNIHRAGLARQVFMDLFRHSNQLKEAMTVEDCREVFLGVLLGEDDLSCGLFDELCREYGTTLNELAEKDGHHFY